MSSLASSLGLSYPFEHGGRKVHVHPRDVDTEAAFTVHAEVQQLRAIQRHPPPHMSQAEYAAALDGWRNDCGAGLYDWGEHGCWRQYLMEPGRKHMLALQISQAPESRMTIDESLGFVEEVWADEPARLALLKVVEVANDDPLRKRRWLPRQANGSAGTR